MAKFPSQRKIMYAGAAVSNGNFAQTHICNLPKDLSILNFRNYASTTRKGVPLVFRVAATVYPSGLDGSGYVTSVSSDVKTTIKFLGAQNNWVMRNAAVKWHAARENMFKRAGIPKKDRGAYSHEIRYAFAAAGETFAAPVDGSGNALTGGTWDLSDIVTAADASAVLKITGIGLDEESGAAATAINIGHSYLMSRRSQLADTNPEVDEGPADMSILRSLLADSEPSGSRIDDINEEARDAQDNPPYELLDVSDSGDVNHDITEEVELGRVTLLPQGSGATLPQTTVIDVPFGLMAVHMAHRDPDDNSGITDDLALGLEVLDIFEMQG
jgi:hypothetical protein